MTATRLADDMFAETGVGYRALACGSLMENMLRQIDATKHQGTFYGPSSGDQKMTAIAKREIAQYAALLLLDHSWGGVEEVPMKGPEEISSNDMAAVMADVLSKPIRFQEIPMDDMHAMLISGGVSEGMADATVALITAKNEDIDNLFRGPISSLTPTTFEHWCRTVFRTAIQR